MHSTAHCDRWLAVCPRGLATTHLSLLCLYSVSVLFMTAVVVAGNI